VCRNAVRATHVLEVLFRLTYCSLAKAELRLAIATVFRRFEKQELFETTRADVDIQHDLFLPQPKLDSKGIRVIFE
jgi:hypothetical protein